MLFEGTLQWATVSFPYIMSTFSVLLPYVKFSEKTSDMMWECLKPTCMSARDKNDWIPTADKFYKRTKAY